MYVTLWNYARLKKIAAAKPPCNPSPHWDGRIVYKFKNSLNELLSETLSQKQKRILRNYARVSSDKLTQGEDCSYFNKMACQYFTMIPVLAYADHHWILFSFALFYSFEVLFLMMILSLSSYLLGMWMYSSCFCKALLILFYIILFIFMV